MLLLIILVVEVCLCFKILKDRQISQVLAISLTAVVAIWYFLPGFIALVYPFEEIAAPIYYVGQNDFIISYLIESIGLFAVLGIFLRIRAIGRSSQLAKTHSNQIIKAGIIYLIIIIYAGTIIYRINSVGFHYLDVNAASLYDETKIDNIINFLGQLLFSAIVLFYILLQNRKRLLNFIYLIIVFESIVRIMSGSRVWLIAPIIIFAFRYIKKAELTKRSLALAMILIVICIYIILPISYAIQEARGMGNIDLLTSINYYSINANNLTFSRMLFNKFDIFSTGVLLIKNSGGLASAGFRPFYGSVLIFIPRAIWPERPVSGSADGTIYGHPSRLVLSSIMPFSDYQNVGIAPLHIALWQLGIFGAVLFIIVVVAFLWIINKFLLSGRLLIRTLGIYLLSIPTFHQIIASPDVIIRQLMTVMILLGLIELLHRIGLPHRIRTMKFSPQNNILTQRRNRAIEREWKS